MLTPPPPIQKVSLFWFEDVSKFQVKLRLFKKKKKNHDHTLPQANQQVHIQEKHIRATIKCSYRFRANLNETGELKTN